MPETPATAAFTYRAFLSYCHRDEAWSRWLHRALEAYRVPSRLVGTQTEAGTVPRRLNPIFRDREELASASELGRRISEALAASQSLIVVCSPASAASHWVNEEVLAWKRMGRGARIFCLIVAGEPNATDMPGCVAEECFCPALRFELGADGEPTTAHTEPIAADARPGKDGKANARLKLIAGMLGVGFDALKQREQHRKVRRMAVVTSVAIVVMAATIALAAYALVSRHQAVAAQQRAQVAQQAAERRQQQAEGLVNFMVGDLNQKLWNLGGLSIIQSVNDKAMAYFESLPPTDVNATALAERATTLEKIGAVRLEAGDARGGLAAFNASTRISAALVARDPGDAARAVAYSRTLAFIGMAYRAEKEPARALQAVLRAKRALQPALKSAPGNHSVLIQAVYVDSGLASTRESLGHAEQAETAYREMLALAQQLTTADPASVQYAQALAAAYSGLGDLAAQRGDLAAAVGRYADANVVATRMLARDPKNTTQRNNTLLMRGVLGNALVLAGDGPRGTRYLREAMDGMRQMAQADPRDSIDSTQFAIYAAELARLERLNGNLGAAEKLNSAAAAIFETIADKGAANGKGQENYAENLIEQAEEAQAAGAHAAAKALANKARHIYTESISRDPNDPDALAGMATVQLLLASTERDPKAAVELRKEALAHAVSARGRRKSLDLVALNVEALLALDRPAEAKPLIDRLWRDGYRDPGFIHALQRAGVAYPANPAFEAKLAAAMRPIDAADAADRAEPLAQPAARRGSNGARR